MPVRLMVVGGFLGAGKTSAIVRLAKMLMSRGYKVGVVTNDQSENLVDTNFLRSEGMPVLEVTRSCFCCNFDEFALKLRTLSQTEFPDTILAEPVGSCTDLVATIFKPLMNDFTKEFVMSPLSVLADPRRVKKFMAAEKAGVLNEINYLFDRQLSEADSIVLNKCDLLTGGEIGELTAFLKKKYKGINVYAVSSSDGSGFEAWLGGMMDRTAGTKASCEIDYDIYAKAEAALGWYNGFATLNAGEKADVNSFIITLMERIRGQCVTAGMEIAHLKAYAVTGTGYAKASITSAEDPLVFNKQTELPADRFNLILNARIEADPDALKEICTRAVSEAARDAGFTLSGCQADSFSPAYPKPKYRIE